MPKSQKNFTLSQEAIHELDSLTSIYETATKALEVAIHDLYQQKKAEGSIMLATKQNSTAFDLKAMQAAYKKAYDEKGADKSRSELIFAIGAHVAFVCSEKSKDYQERQVQLAANAVLSEFRHAMYRRGEWSAR